jgi:hypothetical protein
LTADFATGLQIAARIATDTGHFSDKTLNDDANAPLGEMRHSPSCPPRSAGASPESSR